MQNPLEGQVGIHKGVVRQQAVLICVVKKGEMLDRIISCTEKVVKMAGRGDERDGSATV